MKHLLHTATALGALSLPFFSDAAITMNVPIYGPNNAGLTADVTNDNLGAIYNSGELNIFEELAAALFARPQNQAAYGSMDDLIADWNYSIDTNGEVSNGWNLSSNGDGTFEVTKAPFGADIWQNTATKPNQDTQEYTVLIPLTQLEADGIAGYNPLTDASISLSTTTRADAFVGYDGIGGFQSEGPFYELNVIPEPSSLIGVLGLGALGFAASGRKRRPLPA